MKYFPNILTVLRVLLAFVFIFFMGQGGFASMVMAALVFLIASVTDYYDGYLAKKHNLTSSFGKIMDPIADKLLILVAFFLFMNKGIVTWWMFLVIFLRETIVTGIRLRAIIKGKVLAAEKAGKIKTVLQMTAISIILLYFILLESRFAYTWTSAVHYGWLLAIHALMILAVAMTLFSGILFFKSYRRHLYE